MIRIGVIYDYSQSTTPIGATAPHGDGSSYAAYEKYAMLLSERFLTMGLWIFIFGLAFVGVILAIFFLSVRLSHFPFIQKAAGGRKGRSRLFALLLVIAAAAILYIWLNPINMTICIGHLIAFWLLFELIFLLIGKYSHRQINVYIPGVCGVLLTIVYMLAAAWLCLNVWVKEYSFETPKLKGDLRIVQITDSHMGATFHADGLLEYVHEINKLNPDVVLITGDFVDDGTTKEDMVNSCRALSEFKTKYGVFFSYGNHDKGYFSDEAKGWNNDQLLENLKENGVTVLQDETVLIDDRFYIIGRQDKSEADMGGTRMTPQELTKDLDPDLYKIVMDHQPCEYDDEAKAGVNLVLSGHTHGGQFFPFNQMGVLTRRYERSYGHERRGETDFIVSSGISDWELIFKTGCRSEYVVIDIHGES